MNLVDLSSADLTSIANEVANALIERAERDLTTILPVSLALRGVQDANSIATVTAVRATHRSTGWSDPEQSLGRMFDAAKDRIAEAVREAIVIEMRATLAAANV